ncbi:hypothetical protein [Streptomyces sp. B21-083]|uniref:hypothetical protein n=1 Tax=Streptomyces sp. B21-083 TaxID=3039410 RepID=UPI002FF1048C
MRDEATSFDAAPPGQALQATTLPRLALADVVSASILTALTETRRQWDGLDELRQA